MKSHWDRLPTQSGLGDLRLSPLSLGLGIASLVLLGLGLRKLREAKPDSVPETYRRALRLLARRGRTRPSEQAARDFARLVAMGPQALAPEAARAFHRLTELYLAERFGGRASAKESDRELRALEGGLAPRTRAVARPAA